MNEKHGLPFSPQLEESVTGIACSRSAGIWRIKRAKIILGSWQGLDVDDLVNRVRVPPRSVIRCRKRFATEGLVSLAHPEREPTPRESRVEKVLALLEDPPDPEAEAWDRLTVHYIGRDYTAREIAHLREIIAAHRGETRSALAGQLCELFGLHQSTGGIKHSAAVHTLNRMDMDNIVTLPPSIPGRRHRKRKLVWTIEDPGLDVGLSADELTRLRLKPVDTPADSALWREVMERFHYIEGCRVFGHQIRYLVYTRGITVGAQESQNRRLVAALGFGASAWRLRSRDQFIGWSDEQRERNLHLIVNNVRFLILPWIRSPNLASRILGKAARQLGHDWEARYSFRPVMLETFVQLDRFTGTCYRAANWIRIGTTNGYSLYGKRQKANMPRKAILLYPLCKDFRRRLTGQIGSASTAPRPRRLTPQPAG